MITLYLDQVSEHQRDLSNYSSGRFVFEIAHGLDGALVRLNKVMENLVVDKKRMKQNFEMSRSTIIAEPLYVLLATVGHPDAHEAVRKLTLQAEKGRYNILELLAKDKQLKEYVKKIPRKKLSILANSEKYTGIASQKTIEVCKYWQKQLESFK